MGYGDQGQISILCIVVTTIQAKALLLKSVEQKEETWFSIQFRSFGYSVHRLLAMPP